MIMRETYYYYYYYTTREYVKQMKEVLKGLEITVEDWTAKTERKSENDFQR